MDTRRVWWGRHRFDGKAEYFSQEQLEKAKRLVDRYFENFEQIQSISLHHEKRLTPLVDNEFTRNYLRDSNFDNHSWNVYITRSPIYSKLEGTMGDGQKFEEITTPAGRITRSLSEGSMSDGGLVLGPFAKMMFLDGEMGFMRESTILWLGHHINTDVTMDCDPPGLEEYVGKARAKGTRYDVIVMVRTIAGRDIETRVWFDRETGMPDFVTEHKIDPEPGEDPFHSASAYEYYDIGGVYYPKHALGKHINYQVQSEQHFTNIVIDGSAAE